MLLLAGSVDGNDHALLDIAAAAMTLFVNSVVNLL
jgi:hypothetical protein